jgi:hypothetical protein
MNQMSTKMNQDNKKDWRRSKVRELLVKGYNHYEMATRRQIARGTVNSDLTFLRKQAQENLQHHIHEVVPEEYQKCMVGMNRNLKQTLEIGDSVASDPKTKLQAAAIANECYRYIMDLCTNARIISDALKFERTARQLC